MLNNNYGTNKIGIFDSGLGGLTIAEYLNKSLPTENLLYIGDTAHCPWGDKPTSQIELYTIKLTKFLIEQGCNMIVIACNTASCVALEQIRRQFKQLQIFNVVDPVINYLTKLELPKIANIGIIGTKQTIFSNIYQTRIKKLLNTSHLDKIKTLATPLLVPLIEEGSFVGNPAANLIIEQYLSELDLADNSLLILGCTHYPLIKQHISNYYAKMNKHVMIIDPNQLLAEQITIDLQQLHTINSNRTTNFYCTSNCKFFLQMTRQFFANLTLDFLPLWE
jgi:glutamate racemase